MGAQILKNKFGISITSDRVNDPAAQTPDLAVIFDVPGLRKIITGILVGYKPTTVNNPPTAFNAGRMLVVEGAWTIGANNIPIIGRAYGSDPLLGFPVHIDVGIAFAGGLLFLFGTSEQFIRIDGNCSILSAAPSASAGAFDHSLTVFGYYEVTTDQSQGSVFSLSGGQDKTKQ